jgi:hypothetical protein
MLFDGVNLIVLRLKLKFAIIKYQSVIVVSARRRFLLQVIELDFLGVIHSFGCATISHNCNWEHPIDALNFRIRCSLTLLKGEMCTTQKSTRPNETRTAVAFYVFGFVCRGSSGSAGQ